MIRQMAWRAADTVCAKAPSAAVQAYANDILGWVKWTVLAVMAVCFFGSIGMLVWGRVTHHPKGARLGFDGILIILVGAIVYVVGYAIITTITGTC